MTECSKELAPSTARSVDSEDVFGSNSSDYSDEYFYEDFDSADDEGNAGDTKLGNGAPGNYKLAQKTGQLNTWEAWLVKKLSDEREIADKKKIESELQALQELQLQAEATEKQKRSEELHKQWVEEKNLKIHLQKENEKREQKVKKLLEEEKKAKRDIEAKKKFQKWKKSVAEKKHAMELKEELEKQKQQQLFEEKKKMNAESYQNWLKSKSFQNPVRKTHSPPAPTYVNPNPWIAPTHDGTRRNVNKSSATCLKQNKTKLENTIIQRKDLSFSHCGRIRPHIVHFKRPKSTTTAKRK